MNQSTMPDDISIERELAELRSTLFVEIGRTNRIRRRARIAALSAAVLVVGTGVTAGAIAVHQANQFTIDSSVVCYEGADLGSYSVMLTASNARDAEGNSVDAGKPDPLAQCQLAWRSGSVGQPRPLPDDFDPNTGRFAVPRLALCTSKNGMAAGFPNSDTTVSAAQLCEALGLTPWTTR